MSLGATAACKKADNTAATGSGSAAAVAGSAAVAAGSGAAAAGSAAVAAGSAAAVVADTKPAAMTQATGDDLSLLPVDAELVLGINFQSLQSSALWKQFVEPQMMKNMDELEKFKAKCGFNPLEKVTSVAMGLSNLGPNLKPTGAIVVHGLDKAAMMSCFDKMKEESAAKGTEITKDGDVVILNNTKEGMKSAAMFVNDTTMLMALGGDKDKLALIAKGDAALKTSPMFVDMFGKVNAQHTLWGLMKGSSKVFAPLAGANIKFKAVYGSLNITDGLQIEGRARMDSADQATSLAAMANSKAAQMKMMVDKLDVGVDGNDVKGSVMISAEKLKSLMGLMGMGMGGGGGGMGGGDDHGGAEHDDKPPTP
ncbi:MAG: hypothetical protein NT062_14390 [Proteobacteria bacterium]|nr:hypothetical protein [Pseudomonadota bacterium]